jgi:hypothetical protein
LPIEPVIEHVPDGREAVITPVLLLTVQALPVAVYEIVPSLFELGVVVIVATAVSPIFNELFESAKVAVRGPRVNVLTSEVEVSAGDEV